MDNEKLKQFSEVFVHIGLSIEEMMRAQTLLVKIMCAKCDMPIEKAQEIVDNLNIVIGIKKL